MATFVSELEPKPLWQHFDHILTIPRGSGNEEGMRRYVQEVAARNGCAVRADAAGNLVVAKPATVGHEGAPIVILQSHLDMVNEANSGTVHDFERDPIRPVLDGDILKADGTTLGSDNGIGVAAMLAVLEDKSLAHGPLELLFTIDEERGLSGAKLLDASMLHGRLMVNLDSEEEGELTVGCAGGADSRLALPMATAAVGVGNDALTIRVAGLKGGHSGVDIHLQRGNALKILGRALHAALRQAPLRLASFGGGDKHNAIPREAQAVLVGPAAALASAQATIEADLAAQRLEHAVADAGLAWTLAATPAPAAAWDEESTLRLVRLVEALPHGVQAMSLDLPGLVETSVNLASVKGEPAAARLYLSNRSSVGSALAALRQRVRATAELAGATVEEGSGYPGWKPNMASPLLAITRRVHVAVQGKEAHVSAVHAGLECGLLGEKVPGMDMISFGPTIRFPHSPDEHVEIPTVGRFYRLLTATLAELAKPSA